jgi:hypothetical protein
MARESDRNFENLTAQFSGSGDTGENAGGKNASVFADVKKMLARALAAGMETPLVAALKEKAEEFGLLEPTPEKSAEKDKNLAKDDKQKEKQSDERSLTQGENAAPVRENTQGTFMDKLKDAANLAGWIAYLETGMASVGQAVASAAYNEHQFAVNPLSKKDLNNVGENGVEHKLLAELGDAHKLAHSHAGIGWDAGYDGDSIKPPTTIPKERGAGTELT